MQSCSGCLLEAQTLGRGGSLAGGGKLLHHAGAGNVGNGGFAGVKEMRCEGLGSHVAADDAHFAHAAIDGALGGFEFEDHAAGDDAGLHQVIQFFAGNGGKYFSAIEDAGNIGEIDEVIGAYEFSSGGGHVVGVDVVELVIGAKAEAGGDGKKFFTPKGFEKTDIDAGEIADEA